jgi:hypothetical protein
MLLVGRKPITQIEKLSKKINYFLYSPFYYMYATDTLHTKTKTKLNTKIKFKKKGEVIGCISSKKVEN